jgi:predicted Zn-dependent peptidase
MATLKTTLASIVLVAAALAPAAAQQSPRLRIDFTQETLPNGLTVLYHVDRSTPLVAVEVMYNVGSKHEEPGRTGFAHLFEHIMLFMGSKNAAAGQRFALLEKAGGRAGADINGTTSWDRTNYFEQIPSNQLELALWLESDAMATLLDALSQQKVDNQREVVKNERRQSNDNVAYGSWIEKTLGHVFPVGHPYHHTVIGSMADLSAASLDDVKKFFSTYYVPNNAVLVIAGDIDVAQAKQMVRKHFGWIPRGAPIPKLREMSVPTVIGEPKREVVPDANAAAPAIYLTYRMPARNSPQAAAVSLLPTMLAGGRSSPLYKSLVREQQIAVSVQALNVGLVDGADMVTFVAIGKATTNPDSLEAALIRELDRAVTLLDAPALARARATAQFAFVNALQGNGGFGGRADRLAEGYIYFNNPNHVNTELAALDAVTLPQLQALARERMGANNRVTLVFVPTKPAPGRND